MPLYDSPTAPYGYFRLNTIDGRPLPFAALYLRAKCTVLTGDARLRDSKIFDGDGTMLRG